ncbi:multiple monosaccharide ABC transporter permease [Microbacterium sp. DT81.1]|uniref:multiple monosaccharide ABC transporter permease n=1 Tax=Microbacterium sp. DT81.1 TaxID=3393413 RepID=UPI003CF70910
MTTQTTAPTAPGSTPAPARRRRLKDLGMMFGGSTSSARQFGILGALIAIILFFQLATGGKTLEPGNVINMINANAYVLILAIGMVIVIIAGHIDLSVGSVAAFTGIIVAIALNRWELPWPLAVLLGLMIGGVIGAWHGFWVAYVGVPAFIVTLAGMLIFRGANQFVGNSTTEPIPDSFFLALGGGYLPDPDMGIPYNVPTLILGLIGIIVVVVNELSLRKRQRAMRVEMAPLWVSIVKVVGLVAIITAASLLFAGGRPGTSFPIPGIVVVVLVIIYSFITNSTIIGRHVYAVGGNWHAAELSGVKIRRVNFFAMMNMSILAALAGMVFIARSNASGPGDGTGWELDAIAAVFIGGAAVSGGIGTVIGSIIGALVIAVLNNGLQLMGVPSDRVQMIKGLVLLVAVGIDVWSKRSGGRSLISRFARKGGDLALASSVDRPAVEPGAGSAEDTSRPRGATPYA